LFFYEGRPLIIETDAKVNRGASGGMLIDGRNGNLLGLVTSNTKQAQSAHVFEKINCSVPSHLLFPLIKALVTGFGSLSNSQMEDQLALYSEYNQAKERLWRLQLQSNEEHKLQSSQLFSFIKSLGNNNSTGEKAKL